MNTSQKSTLILLLSTILYLTYSCKKDIPVLKQKVDSENKPFKGVSYDASHNVLVFESQQAIVDLEETLIELEKNFPYNRGNTDAIFLRIQQIREHGYTNGNGPSFGTQKVSLKDFEELLTESYPLSDEVLLELLDLNEEVSLTPPFVRDVFIQNVPFSFHVLNTIEDASIPNGIKKQIIDADDAKIDVPDFAFEEFLAAFPGYKSLYEKLKNEEIQKLQNGMDPIDPGFDSPLEDVVYDDFLQLIMNENMEVYVNRHTRPDFEFDGTPVFGLYKLYDSCRAIVFQNSITEAYSDVVQFDQNGNIGGLPIIIESDLGVSINQMNNYVPTNAIVFNPQYMNPGNNGGDPFYQTEAQTHNLNDGCPKSYFNYVDGDNLYDFKFNSYTDINYPNETFFQYWLFGDGTGSFAKEPIHDYQTEGTYEVKLITFTDDCACWHVNKKTIVIDQLSVQLRTGCAVAFQYLEGLDKFTAVATPSQDYPNAFVTSYNWSFTEEFSNGSLGQTQNFTTLSPEIQPTNLISDGNYVVGLSVTWSEGCNGSTNAYPANEKAYSYNKTSLDDCCWKKSSKTKEVDKFQEYQLGNRNYRLKIKDQYKFNPLFSSSKVKLWQRFYRENNIGIFVWRKAQRQEFDILNQGNSLYEILFDNDEKCSETPKGSIDNYFDGDPDNRCNNCRKLSNSFPQNSVSQFNSRYGIREHSLEIEHRVKYNDVVKSFVIVLGRKPDECPI